MPYPDLDSPENAATSTSLQERVDDGGAAGGSFAEGATSVMVGLQNAVNALFDALPGEKTKAADVERAFGIDHKLGWQVHQLATAANPLAAAEHVPVRSAIQRLLKSASRRRVPGDVMDRVTTSLDEFERFVETHAGGRADFNSMVGAFLPEVHQKRELVGKKTAFQGVSQIKGVAAEADFCAFFLHPSSDPLMADRATLSGRIGLRRVHPSSHIGFATVGTLSPQGSERDASQQIYCIDGTPTDGPMGTLLPQFSSKPSPRFRIQRADYISYYWVAGDEVGLRSAVNLTIGEYRPASVPRYRKPGGTPVAGVLEMIDVPTKRATIDVFVHADIYPSALPMLATYDASVRGPVRMHDDPHREHDRLQLHESLRPLAGGLDGARLPHVPHYFEMLDYVCSARGWNPDGFRGYRLDVQYPFYASQFMIGFLLSDAPGGEGRRGA